MSAYGQKQSFRNLMTKLRGKNEAQRKSIKLMALLGRWVLQLFMMPASSD